MAAIESFSPDALLVYGWNFDGHLAAMRHFHGSVPVWFRGDSTLLDPLPFWKRTLRKLTLNWVYRFVDRAFYVGQANKRYFLWCGLKEDQLTYAPHAVDNEFFMADDEKRQRRHSTFAMNWESIQRRRFSCLRENWNPKSSPLNWPKHLSRSKHKRHLIYVGSGVLETQLKSDSTAIPTSISSAFKTNPKCPFGIELRDVFCLPSEDQGNLGIGRQ